MIRTSIVVLFALLSLIFFAPVLSKKAYHIVKLNSINSHTSSNGPNPVAEASQNTQIHVKANSESDSVTKGASDITSSKILSQNVAKGGNATSLTAEVNGNSIANISAVSKNYNAGVIVNTEVEVEVDVDVELDSNGEALVEVELEVEAEAVLEVYVEGMNGLHYYTNPGMNLSVNSHVSSHVENGQDGGKDVDVDVGINVDIDLQIQLSSDSSDDIDIGRSSSERKNAGSCHSGRMCCQYQERKSRCPSRRENYGYQCEHHTGRNCIHVRKFTSQYKGNTIPEQYSVEKSEPIIHYHNGTYVNPDFSSAVPDKYSVHTSDSDTSDTSDISDSSNLAVFPSPIISSGFEGIKDSCSSDLSDHSSSDGFGDIKFTSDSCDDSSCSDVSDEWSSDDSWVNLTNVTSTEQDLSSKGDFNRMLSVIYEDEDDFSGLFGRYGRTCEYQLPSKNPDCPNYMINYGLVYNSSNGRGSPSAITDSNSYSASDYTEKYPEGDLTEKIPSCCEDSKGDGERNEYSEDCKKASDGESNSNRMSTSSVDSSSDDELQALDLD